MAKKRRSRRNGGMTIPISVVAGLLPGTMDTVDGFRQYGLKGGATVASRVWTGYDPQSNKWYWSQLQRGAVPLLVGMLVHNVASRLGVNRALGRAKIPFVRI